MLPQMWDTAFSPSEDEGEGRGKGKGETYLLFTSAYGGLLLFPHLARRKKKWSSRPNIVEPSKWCYWFVLYLTYITIHVEQAGHSSCLRENGALLDSFSQTWASKILWWYPLIYFHNENSVQHPSQTVKYGNNCYQDAKGIPTVSGRSFQIWFNDLPF